MAIPGMITGEECDLLTEIAQEIDLTTGSILEVGPFFGRSTAALLRGVKANRTLAMRSRQRPIISVDRFAWPIGDAHAIRDVEGFIRSFAESEEVNDMITVVDGRVEFRKVFDHFAAEDPLVDPIACDLRELESVGSRLSVLFLDGPKTAHEVCATLSATEEGLCPSAHVIFQDFFFHTSGELIAVVGSLMEQGALTPIRAVCSSLVCQWTPRSGAIATDEWLLDPDEMLRCVGLARQWVTEACASNDPTRFLPRLVLAEAQLAFSQGAQDHAAAALAHLRSEWGVRAETWADLCDLVRVRFQTITPEPPRPIEPR